jgi:hypothetical protein
MKLLRKVADGLFCFFGLIFIALIDLTYPLRKRWGWLTEEEIEGEYYKGWSKCGAEGAEEEKKDGLDSQEKEKEEREVIAGFKKMGIPPEKIGENIGML